jgi:uncharacterized protein YcfL
MRVLLLILLSFVTVGCSSEPQPLIIEVRTQRLNPEWVRASQEIDETILKLIKSLNQQNN